MIMRKYVQLLAIVLVAVCCASGNANDDGSAGPIPIGSRVDFFGVEHDMVFLNNNGNITFGSLLAVDDTATVAGFGLVSINVIRNDSFPITADLSVELVDPPSTGTANLAGFGTAGYIAGIAQGTDSFTYRLTEPTLGNSDLANVTVIIGNSQNEPPVVNSDSNLHTWNSRLDANDPSGFSTPDQNDDGVLANDFDPEAQPLTLANAGIFQATGIGGEVALFPNGSLSYLPPPDSIGFALFPQTINDGVQDFASSPTRERLTWSALGEICAPDVLSGGDERKGEHA